MNPVFYTKWWPNNQNANMQTNLLSIASVIFLASKHLGPPRIQTICPEGPVTWIKSSYHNQTRNRKK